MWTPAIMQSISPAIAAMALLCSLSWSAIAQPTPPSTSADMPIASCVEDTPGLALPAGDQRALLDANDRALFELAVLQRFPALHHAGYVAGQVLLWGRGRAADDPQGWLYISLLRVAMPVARRGADPTAEATGTLAQDTAIEEESVPCFTAVFAAPLFEFTADLVRKYFAGGGRI